jgi:L-ascorbate metabolism protein UlaG (beta-lactamase superfamily)
VRAAVTWLGHATVLVETGGVRVAVDPLLRARVVHLRRQVEAVDPRRLGRLAAVLISHQHRDHLDLPSLHLLEPGFRVIAPRGTGRLLRRAGFADITELEPGETTTVGGLAIEATPAVHDGRRMPVGPPLPALGFLIGSGPLVYHAGDTDLFDGLESIGARGIDVALLPISGWGPAVGPGHLDPVRAAQAAAMLRPRICIPIHHGTYRGAGRGRRPSGADHHLEEFLAELARVAPGVIARPLAPGETLEVG